MYLAYIWRRLSARRPCYAARMAQKAPVMVVVGTGFVQATHGAT
jgi:hypothetical protein